MTMKTEGVPGYRPGLLIILAAAVLALFIFKDYGMAWDEGAQRDIGMVNFNFIVHNDPALKSFGDRDYGPAFELPLVVLEKAFDMEDYREIFLMRHLVQHFFFLFSLFIGYLLMLRTFRNQLVAILGLLILLLTPRLFAHSFFNSKDIPFMCMFIICFATSHWAFRKNTPGAYLLLGAITAYATCVRLLSIMLFAIFLGFLLVDMITVCKDRAALRKKLLCFLCYIVSFCTILFACWPYLWDGPVANLVQAFRNFSKFRWIGTILFNGTVVQGTELSWTYVPVWFGISVPVLWLLLGIIGLVLFIAAFTRRPLRFITNTPERNFTLYFITLLAPVLMVILLHSVVYDDWRHLYFIYPSFVMLLLFGVDKLLQNKKASSVLGGLCVLQFVFIAVFMVRFHPFQQVYFNELLPKGDEYLREHYELDYWGSSNKQALEYILKHDRSADIKINDGPTQQNNWKMLPAEDRERIRPVTGNEQPDYYLDLFRTYAAHERGPEVYRIKVQNSTIMKVYKYEK